MPSVSRVFSRNGSWHIDMGRDDDGKRRSRKLCRIAEGESALYSALAKVTRPRAQTVGDLLDSFQIHKLKELAPSTQKDYRGYIDRHLKPVFEDATPDEVEPVHVAQYLEKRSAKKVANKEIACLSSAFEYGMRIGLCTRNPCRGVRRNKVKPKDRYVRDEQYLLYFDAAQAHVQDLMAGIYLMELRPGEARDLLKNQITPKGVRFEESKTGKVKEISWSPALQYFLTRATSRFPKSPYVFANSRGEHWTEWAMHSALRRLRADVGGPSWTWHDLRAKGESDHESGGMGLMPLYKRSLKVRPVR